MDLDRDSLADVDGDAVCVFKMAGVDPSDPPSIYKLISILLGAPPTFARIRDAGCLARVGDGWRVFIRAKTPAPRARHVAAHELAHFYYDRCGYFGDDIEARCDALGASLIAPRIPFQRAVAEYGCRVHALAEAFGVTQSVALLRVGEVASRPVVLLRSDAPPIVRGDEFSWPDAPRLRQAIRLPPPGVHPLRIVDESRRWGLMATAA